MKSPESPCDGLPEAVSEHVALLVSSFRRVTGRCLGDASWESMGPETLAEAVHRAPCVIASHGVEADPVLNYGNLRALELWETDWESFTSMPSRLTAEPVEREEREGLLREVTENGFIDDYSGIRISTTGKRFLIRRATVWNIIDAGGRYRGQAVIFSDWEPVSPE